MQQGRPQRRRARLRAVPNYLPVSASGRQFPARSGCPAGGPYGGAAKSARNCAFPGQRTAIWRAKSSEKRQVVITNQSIGGIPNLFILRELRERRSWKSGSRRGRGSPIGLVRTGQIPDRLDRGLRTLVFYLPVCAKGRLSCANENSPGSIPPRSGYLGVGHLAARSTTGDSYQ
jgi:hypothetical protein